MNCTMAAAPKEWPDQAILPGLWTSRFEANIESGLGCLESEMMFVNCSPLSSFRSAS